MSMKNSKEKEKVSVTALLCILIPTFFYWYWESKAEGNIRIDLMLIYPILFSVYIKALWNKFSYYAILLSILLMVVNIIYSIFSYQLFDKYPG